MTRPFDRAASPPPPSVAALDDERLAQQQLQLTLASYQTSVLVPVLPVLATAALFSVLMPWPPLLVWTCLQLAASVATYLFMKHRAARIAPTQRAVRWVQGVVAAWGFCWGASMILVAGFAREGSDQALGIGLTVAVLGGVNALSLARLGALFPASKAYLLGLMSSFLVAMFFVAPIRYAPIGVMAIFYTFMVMAQARRTAQTLAEGMQLRFENQQLVDTLREQTAQAQQARAQAEKANANKSHFLAAASHDLRQPLHALGLFLEVLSRSKLSGEQQQLLDKAQMAAAGTGDMLNTLLDYSRIEAGVIAVHRKPVALQELLHHINVSMAPMAEERGLVFRQRDTNLSVMADAALTDAVLRNLVSNAVRYTERGGVLLACRKRGDEVWIQVWDTGVGIAQQDQERVFEEFTQVDNAERDRRKGLGLGLAIVRRLCDAMGATVHLRSVVGRGTVVSLVLPLHTGMVSAAAPHAHDTDLPQSPAAGTRVLLLDDEAAVRAGLSQLLKSFGLHPFEAGSLEEALAHLSQGAKPDVLLVDLRLRDGLSGTQALATLRKAMNAPNLPAVIVTGDTAPQRLRNAHSANAQLLHKPVGAQALLKAMHAAMSA
jgi:two-component system, sensor histidine kinase